MEGAARTALEALEAWLLGPCAAQGYLLAPPGRMYNYSNLSFVVAGLLIERASGTFCRSYMSKQVFEPLGMGRTFLRVRWQKGGLSDLGPGAGARRRPRSARSVLGKEGHFHRARRAPA